MENKRLTRASLVEMFANVEIWDRNITRLVFDGLVAGDDPYGDSRNPVCTKVWRATKHRELFSRVAMLAGCGSITTDTTTMAIGTEASMQFMLWQDDIRQPRALFYDTMELPDRLDTPHNRLHYWHHQRINLVAVQHAAAGLFPEFRVWPGSPDYLGLDEVQMAATENVGGVLNPPPDLLGAYYYSMQHRVLISRTLKFRTGPRINRKRHSSYKPR